MEVKRAVFDVIEDPEAPTHHEPGISENIPSEAYARSPVVLVREDQCSVRSARIAGIEDARRRVGENLGLRTCSEEPNDVVMRVVLRAVVLVSYAKVHSQPRTNLDRVLRVVVLRCRANVVKCAGELEEIPGESADEIGRCISCECTSRQRSIGGPAKCEAAIVEEVEQEVVLDTADVHSELPLVAPVRDDNVVLHLIRHVVELGWSLR